MLEIPRSYIGRSRKQNWQKSSWEDIIDEKQSEKLNDDLKAVAEMAGSSEFHGSEIDVFFGNFDHHS